MHPNHPSVLCVQWSFVDSVFSVDAESWFCVAYFFVAMKCTELQQRKHVPIACFPHLVPVLLLLFYQHKPVPGPLDPKDIFYESLKDLTVHEGEPATFTAILKLSPEELHVTNTQWYFEDDPIEESDIYKITATPGGIHSLYLPEAFPEDAGKYTLEIEYLERGEKCYEDSNAFLRVDGTFCLQSFFFAGFTVGMPEFFDACCLCVASFV